MGSSRPLGVTDVVDANVHLVADAGRAGIRGWASDWPPHRSLTVEAYRGAMEAAGVTRAVLATTTRRDGFDNTYTVAAASTDARFAPVGNVDVLAPAAVATIERWAAAGLRGIRLYGGSLEDASAWLDDARAAEAWRRAGELGLAVSAQRTRARALEPLARMAGRHPDVPVVVYSAGDPAFDDGGSSPEVDALVALASRANVFLLFSASALRSTAAGLGAFLERVAGAYGPKRLMWGSYSLFRGARSADDAVTLDDLVAAVRERFAFLGEEGLSAVLGGTAASLFFPVQQETP